MPERRDAPGTFYIAHGAELALIATLSFSAPLQLLDLTGLAASRLGIYDQLRSPDHGWCQWLGWQPWVGLGGAAIRQHC